MDRPADRNASRSASRAVSLRIWTSTLRRGIIPPFRRAAEAPGARGSVGGLGTRGAGRGRLGRAVVCARAQRQHDKRSSPAARGQQAARLLRAAISTSTPASTAYRDPRADTTRYGARSREQGWRETSHPHLGDSYQPVPIVSGAGTPGERAEDWVVRQDELSVSIRGAACDPSQAPRPPATRARPTTSSRRSPAAVRARRPAAAHPATSSSASATRTAASSS